MDLADCMSYCSVVASVLLFVPGTVAFQSERLAREGSQVVFRLLRLPVFISWLMFVFLAVAAVHDLASSREYTLTSVGGAVMTVAVAVVITLVVFTWLDHALRFAETVEAVIEPPPRPPAVGAQPPEADQ